MCTEIGMYPSVPVVWNREIIKNYWIGYTYHSWNSSLL